MPSAPAIDAAAWLSASLRWHDVQVSDVALDVPASRMRPEAIVAVMALVTRTIHELDPGGCPSSVLTDELVERARHRVAAGEVDASGFAAPYRRYRPAELLAILLTSSSSIGGGHDPVVTHGALTPANVHVEGGLVTRVAPGVMVGVGDRYRDLAITSAALAEVVGPGAVAPFFAECGIDRPDPARLDFFVLLSQFG